MNLDSFKWLNESKITVDGDTLTIFAPARTDFFNNPVPDPESGKFLPIQKNAPIYYTDVEGDFVVRAKVSPNFKTTWDAACIMVVKDENMWIKAAFEKTDIDTLAVVSVVTNGRSDDANGCNIEADELWLQVARVGDNFAIHYSLDGEKFDMVRLCLLPVGTTVKVGLEAQCPVGEGGDRQFSNFSIEKRTIAKLRDGK